ncbi:STAS domain-containing protein [Gorillibacterium timonense]|uniref:STAS domain-containing protein n=1 Tax=Gorillibacterium timonense TaxID=1689269 RepID=UPI0018FE8FBD|nr:STAS domain-containing protein [Gorillibacterium timonense]
MKEITIQVPEIFSVEEAGHFREHVRAHINSGTIHFLLDFSNCQFIDSTGLGVIVSSHKKCMESGGGMKLKSLNRNVFKVFELTRLTNVFEIL